MQVHAGDTLTAKTMKRLRIEVIDTMKRTVLVTDLDTKKTQLLSWETLQLVDEFLNFKVEHAKITQKD
jgi:hypothetical protein